MQNKGASSIVVYRQYLHKFFSVLSIASVAASFLHASAKAPSNDRKQIIPALLHREHVASVSFAQIMSLSVASSGRHVNDLDRRCGGTKDGA